MQIYYIHCNCKWCYSKTRSQVQISIKDIDLKDTVFIIQYNAEHTIEASRNPQLKENNLITWVKFWFLGMVYSYFLTLNQKLTLENFSPNLQQSNSHKTSLCIIILFWIDIIYYHVISLIWIVCCIKILILTWSCSYKTES